MRVLGAGVERGGADAGCEVGTGQRAEMRNAQLAHGFEHCAGRAFGVAAVRAEQYGDQLFAAVASDQVERAAVRGATDCHGDIAQALVAGLMAVVIVVSLEVVDIDQHDRHGDPIARGLLIKLAHLFLERRAIQQPGQAVVHGHLGKPPPIEKRHPVRALERVTAACADQVRAEQRPQLISRDVRSDGPSERDERVRAHQNRIRAQRRRERQREHEIEEERREHEARRDQRQLFR